MVMKVNSFDMALLMSTALDLVDNDLFFHHQTTAYIAQALAERLGYDDRSKKQVLLAALYHDIGAITLKEKQALLDFDANDGNKHGFTGYNYFRKYPLFNPIASIIKYHHLPWNQGQGMLFNGESVPEASHVIHLADRVAVQISQDKPVNDQIHTICEKIQSQANTLFAPSIVTAFNEIALKPAFWIPIASHNLKGVLQRTALAQSSDISGSELEQTVKMFAQILDFRSRYMYAHSYTIAAVAMFCAKKAGLNELDSEGLQIAAYLHDIGSLAIPAEILDKTEPLSEREINIIKTHPFNAFILLKNVKGCERIAEWVGCHHEKINGKGYPFGKRAHDIPLPARILHVAEAFTAMNEERAYRKAHSLADIAKILLNMSDQGDADPVVVRMVIHEIDSLAAIIKNERAFCLKEYTEWGDSKI